MGGKALWECEAMGDGTGRGCALWPSPLTAGVIAWPRSTTRAFSTVLSAPQREFQSDQQGRSLPPPVRAKIIGLCPGDCAKIAIQLFPRVCPFLDGPSGPSGHLALPGRPLRPF